MADNLFELDENGRKFSKPVESTMGKGEIARYKQFILFPQCFQRTCTADMLKPGLVWERVKEVSWILKTLWENEKMLVTIIFPFSPTLYPPCQKLISLFKPLLRCCLQIQFGHVWKRKKCW